MVRNALFMASWHAAMKVVPPPDMWKRVLEVQARIDAVDDFLRRNIVGVLLSPIGSLGAVKSSATGAGSNVLDVALGLEPASISSM